MDNKVIGTLGLCARARKLVSGDSVMKSIQNKNAKLVILSSDMGDNMKKKLINKCEFYKIPYVFIESSDMLNQAIGDVNRKAVAITDEGFAQKLHTCWKG